jgi:hypothetical protein
MLTTKVVYYYNSLELVVDSTLEAIRYLPYHELYVCVLLFIGHTHSTSQGPGSLSLQARRQCSAETIHGGHEAALLSQAPQREALRSEALVERAPRCVTAKPT